MKALIRFLLILMLWIVPLNLFAIEPSSNELNTMGMEEYYQGNMIGASEYFIRAIEDDETNFYAHYNLACTLTLIREVGESAPFDIRESVALGHLERAVSLSDWAKGRYLEDPDLDAVRESWAIIQTIGKSRYYYRLLGFYLASISYLETTSSIHRNAWRYIISGITWTLADSESLEELTTSGEGRLFGTLRFTLDGSFTMDVPSLGFTGAGWYVPDGNGLLLQGEEGSIALKSFTVEFGEDDDIRLSDSGGRKYQMMERIEDPGGITIPLGNSIFHISPEEIRYVDSLARSDNIFSGFTSEFRPSAVSEYIAYLGYDPDNPNRFILYTWHPDEGRKQIAGPRNLNGRIWPGSFSFENGATDLLAWRPVEDAAPLLVYSHGGGVYTYAPDSGRTVKLTAEENCVEPYFSYKGDSIFYKEGYYVEGSFAGGLYTMNLQGSNRRLLRKIQGEDLRGY